MQALHSRPPPPTPRSCVVCAEPLAWNLPLRPAPAAAGAPSDRYALCMAFACRTVFAEVGRTGGDFHRRLLWRAQVWRKDKIKSDLWAERIRIERSEEAAAFAALARRRPNGSPPDLHLVVPNGYRPLRAVSGRRRQAHAVHLDTIIAQAPARTDSAPALSPEAQGSGGLPGRLCGACGGGCCTAGGEKSAYLTPSTIRRVLDADLSQTPAALKAAYLAHVPERAVSRSCLYHTREGCALPRPLRSDTCNHFACLPFKRLQGALAADPPMERVLVLRRRQSHWTQWTLGLNNDLVGAAILTEAATRRRRLPKPAAGEQDG